MRYSLSTTIVVTYSLCLFLSGSLVSRGDTHYVDRANGAGESSPYTSWATAAKAIQDAIDVAVAGDVVLVTNGTYNTGGQAYGTEDLTNRIVIISDIVVRSVTGDPADALILGAPDTEGGSISNGPWAIRCVRMTAGSLIGFTITNGYTSIRDASPWTDAQAGGIYTSGSCIISNCLITGNQSSGGNSLYGGGGGVAGAGGNYFDCRIMHNTCELSGGGGRGGSFWNCSIVSNTAQSSYGGGLFSAVACYDCEFIGNYVQGEGGALYIRNAGVYSNCVFKGNEATVDDSAFKSVFGSACFYDCLFESNICAGGMCDTHGGPASFDRCIMRGHNARVFEDSVYLTNCVIVNNGSVFTIGSSMMNCTIADNSGAVFPGAGTYSVTNCIVFGNNPDLTAGVTYNMSYSCIHTDGVAATVVGAGIITNNPRFTDSTNGDYSIILRSPCFNTGVNLDWMTNSLDLSGSPRLDYLYHQVDMGAYEFVPPPPGAVFTIR